MNTLLNNIKRSMETHNIIFPRWNKLMYSLSSYFKNDIVRSKSPVWVKAVKVVCDAVDLITYNAWAFFGMALCFIIVFP